MKNYTKTGMDRLSMSFWLIMVIMLGSLTGFSQNVAINSTQSPANPASGLDVNFTSMGFLISRVSLTGTANAAPLQAHVAGMIVYNTATVSDVAPGLYWDNGSRWVRYTIPKGTNNGDMFYWSGTSWNILPAGQTGQKLQLGSSGLPSWNTGSLPVLTTTAVSAVTITTAVSGGNITGDGGTAVTARGVCWNTVSGPTTANSKTTDGSGTGIFVSNLAGLTTGTTYYVRAYATNTSGTSYGNEISFVTP